MPCTGMVARDKGVQFFDLMRESVPDKEIQRPIGDRRLGAETVGTQLFQYIVGSKRAMFVQQIFQHLAPHRRKAQSVFRALPFGGGQRA